MPSVAIIGSGVSGLTAAYALRNTHAVSLFERDVRLGGHAHTHTVTASDGRVDHIDSGFIVHNERTYPTLVRIFGELGIETRDTEMSMSIRCDGCGLEYAGGRGARGIFAQRRRLADPRHLRLLLDVPRFHREARALLSSTDGEDPTWGEFLAKGGYSAHFVRHFAIPLVSCVWSSGDENSMAYPARHLFAFLQHHGMLSLTDSPTWRTVIGGSARYVAALAATLPDVRPGVGAVAVRRHADGVEVTTDDGTTRTFDQVVLATHADQAARLLMDASDDERRDLGAITYSRNTTWLHRDTSVLPDAAGARASWNYRIDACSSTSERVLVSYWMNRLHRIDSADNYLVTLNPAGRVDPASAIARMEYEHPVFTREAVAAAGRLRGAGGPHLAFAGAHLGWGFHEDGARSGVEAARKLGSTW